MTLLISIENGFSARYLLRTGLLEILQEANVPVMIASPNADEPCFRDSFKRPGIRLIPQPSVPPQSHWRRQLELIRFYGLPHSDPTTNIGLKYRNYCQAAPMRPVLMAANDLLVRSHRSLRFARTSVAKVGQRLDVQQYTDILRKNNVRLLLLDGIGSSGPHVGNWARAARNTCRSLTVITNWDHPTTKGYRSTPTDHYLVWGRVMQEELVRYHDIPVKMSQIVGAAIFDVYFQPNALLDRAEICNRFGLDPNRPIVLYAANSPVGFPHNADIVAYLANAFSTWPDTPQLVVRLHPLYLHGSTPRELERHAELSALSGVAYSYPRILSTKLIPDMSGDEIGIAASLIKSADVIVNLFSTLQLDACVCDKPIVNIGFAWDTHRETSGTQHPEHFAGFLHLRPLVEANATAIAANSDQLLQLIRQALDQPGLQREERKLIVQRNLFELDGYAIRRIGQAVVDQYQLALAGV